MIRTALPRFPQPFLLSLVLGIGLLPAPVQADTEPAAPALPVAKLEKRLPPAPKAFDKMAPSLEDLKAIQQHVKTVVEFVMPATVCIRIGAGSGSGVIISEDGYVLTAGHVAGDKPGREAVIILPNGKQLKGKTLGVGKGIDSGLVKITTPGKYFHVELGSSTGLHKGDWCIAIGHPGGYKDGRSPPVRLGKILENTRMGLRTDCTLVGGDSGGPLFDIQGRVIGIHSRIGTRIDANVHVPVDTYKDTWERLATGEVWGKGLGDFTAAAPYLGVMRAEGAENCEIKEVRPNSPAEKAGLKAGDIIVKLGTSSVRDFDQLIELVARRKIGERVALEVRRGEETVQLQATLGRLP